MAEGDSVRNAVFIYVEDIFSHTYDAERARRLQLKFIVSLLLEGLSSRVQVRAQWRVTEKHICV